MSLNKKEHDYWYAFLVKRDGEICQMCHKMPNATKREFFVPRLLIHEKRYHRPLQEEDLSLLCDSCNQYIHPPKEEKFKREMSPELAINRAKEPRARQYLINRVLIDGHESYNTLVNSCAEKVGVSIKAVDTYMDKLTSDEGPLINTFDEIYVRGYEPKFKFDLLSNLWVTVQEAKPIPPEIIKEIQASYQVLGR